jgi:MYXO-CTERM domain-containing protein
VHGADDRREYFEAPAGARERLEQSAVALMPKSSLRGHELAPDVLSWADKDGLCTNERFAQEPAAAFCSGVLVDWDLVLTAGHCVRALSLRDLAIVFGYYYSGQSELTLGPGDVFDAVEIVAEALDPAGVEPRHDYAWLRLSRPVSPPRQPAPLALHAPLEVGVPLLALSTPGGVPFKADSGGHVSDARAPLLDFFTADTDTSHGSSGGGAFDEQLSLVGVLARGGEDFVQTDQGCLTSFSLPDSAPSEEQYSYTTGALQALCAKDPHRSLCRADCGDPCEALPRQQNSASARALSCSLSPPGNPSPSSWLFLAVLATGQALRRRRAVLQNNVRSVS